MTNTASNTMNQEAFFEGDLLGNLLQGALSLPMVGVNREDFLRRELGRYYPEEMVTEAVRRTPAAAGIPGKTIDYIADRVIEYEAAKLGMLSAAVSIPGGVAAVSATAADSLNYCAFSVRVMQKLAYLYGFQELNVRNEGNDTETMYMILVFMGTMFGVQEATRALMQIMEMYARNVADHLARKALTKGMVYPIVKSIAKEIGVKMTKQIFADGVASAIPVVSGLCSGGMSYVMFTAACRRLQRSLRKGQLAVV